MYTFVCNPLRLTCFILLQIVLRKLITNKHTYLYERLMWRSWLRYCTTRRSCGFDCRWCCWNFLFTYSVWPQYGTGFDSASNTNEYQQYFLQEERGVKGGRCVGLTTLLPSCAHCFEICGLQIP